LPLITYGVRFSHLHATSRHLTPPHVISDSDDDILRDLYRYDARAHTWSRAPVLTTARTLPHRYDARAHTWSRCRDAPHGRCWHSATVVGGSVSGNSNVILVFGGETLKPNAPVRQPLSSMLSYDPEFDIFYDAVDRGHRPSARIGHTASLHTVCRSGLQMALECV
jgi:hypothetical protein